MTKIPIIIILFFFLLKIKKIIIKKRIDDFYYKNVKTWDFFKNSALKKYYNKDLSFKTVSEFFYTQGGGYSRDQDDPAAPYAPGEVHTVHDVTFPTFKAVFPGKTYDDFLNMTKKEFLTVVKYKLNEARKYNSTPPFDYFGLYFLWAGTDKKVLKKLKNSKKIDDIYDLFLLQANHYKSVTLKNPSTKKYLNGWLTSLYVYTNIILNYYKF